MTLKNSMRIQFMAAATLISALLAASNTAAQESSLANPPTYDFAQLIEALTLRSDEGLEEVQQADGSVSIDLQNRYRNVTLGRVDDGERR